MQLGVLEGIATALAIAGVLGIVFTKFKQPLIVAFIVAGIIVGPVAFDFISSEAAKSIYIMAEIGIAIMLFGVGLKIDAKEIKANGLSSLMVGVGKMAVFLPLGFLVALLFGKDALNAFYVGLAIIFSSTIIVIKLLAESRGTDSVFGRIAIGALIIEDLFAIAAIVVITSLGTAATGVAEAGQNPYILMAIGGVLSVAGIFLLARFLFPRLLPALAKAGREPLVLFSSVWAVGIGVLFYYLGLGIELGAFVAGIALASSPLREEMSKQLYNLRDFLLIFFFIFLGMGLDLAAAITELPIALVLSVLILIGVPLLVTAIMALMGYRHQVGFKTGVVLGQMSEISLIFAGLAYGFGFIGMGTVGAITMTALITMAGSTYSMRYVTQFYEMFRTLLKPHIPRRVSRVRADLDPASFPSTDAIVLGLGRYGTKVARGMALSGKSVLGIDFEAARARREPEENLQFAFGDIEDPDLASKLDLGSIQWIISTIPYTQTNLDFARMVREHGYKGSFAAMLHYGDDVKQYEEAGIDQILTPIRDAAEQTVNILLGRERHHLPLDEGGLV
jgi:Kef-type K+ transport system membrane component KefB